jgi:hypothetical protein
MLIATFNATTGWVGKTITFENEQFILQDYGRITAAGVMEYDRQRYLIWPYDGMRTWVAARLRPPAAASVREVEPAAKSGAMRATIGVSAPVDEASDLAMMHWSCIGDADSCNACRAMENTTWLPGVTPPASDPLPTCASPEGCRCVTIYEIAQEGSGEPADVAYVRSLGGVATGQQMDERVAAQDAKRYAQRQDDKMRQASDNVRAAWRLEKTDPDKVVTMYRESLAVYRDGLSTPAGKWLPSHVHFAYSRPTMLLEKLGRTGEALQELDAHDALGLPPEGQKSVLDAMAKRKERLARKLAR